MCTNDGFSITYHEIVPGAKASGGGGGSPAWPTTATEAAFFQWTPDPNQVLRASNKPVRETVTTKYVYIEFDRDTWKRVEEHGCVKYISPPIELPKGINNAIAIISFDGDMVATAHLHESGPVELGTSAT